MKKTIWTSVYFACTLLSAGLLAERSLMAERIVDLEEIGNRWFFTVVFSDMKNPSVPDQQLISILNQDRRLQSLMAQAVYHAWDNSTEMVQTSIWKKALGDDRPSVILQSPADEKGNSEIVFFASGANVHSDQRLAREIQLAINRFQEKITERARPRPLNPRPAPEPNPRCPLNPRPTPAPAPVPTPAKPPEIPQTPAVVEPEPAPDDEYIPLWSFFLPLLGAGLGIRKSLKAS